MKNKGPLIGMRVIELTSYVAAPITGRILADWGADVIKVEGLAGDMSRWMGLALNIDNGEHSREILSEARFSQEEIQTLCNNKVIRMQ